MKFNIFCIVLVSLAVCSAVEVKVDNTNAAASFDIDASNVATITVPEPAKTTVTLKFLNGAPPKCSWDATNPPADAYFSDTGDSIELVQPLENLLECDFQTTHATVVAQGKRAYVSVSETLKNNYNVLWNTLEITRKEEKGSSSVVQQDIEVWWPKSVVARGVAEVAGRSSFITSANMEVSYNPRPTDPTANKWTVKITLNPEFPYNIADEPTLSVEVGSREVSAGQLVGNVFTFTVNGGCEGWSTQSGAKLTVVRDGQSSDDNDLTESEDILITINTVSACALTKGFNFGEPEVTLYSDAPGGTKADSDSDFKFKKTSTVHLAVELESPDVDVLHYEITSICVESSTNTDECGTVSVPSDQITSVEGTTFAVGASFPANSLRPEPDDGTNPISYDLLITIQVTFDSSRKRSVVLRKARTVLKISDDDSVVHSSASLSSIGALFMVVLALLA